MTPEQHAERRTRIGGSDAGKIAAGEWQPLWLEKTGRVEPEDLSWVLPVQIGLATEAVNLAFFEHATGHSVFGQGEVYVHPAYPFVGVTIDGLAMIGKRPAIIQCKHVNPFSKIEEIEQRYYPQVSHEMLCTGADRAFLSVILGTQKHEIVEIERDQAYIGDLLAMEIEFWRHVTDDIEPTQGKPLAVPEKPVVFREVDMHASNAWANNAGEWLDNVAASKVCERSAKELRSLVEPDVGKAFGHGVAIVRDKAGRLNIREMK